MSARISAPRPLPVVAGTATPLQGVGAATSHPLAAPEPELRTSNEVAGFEYKRWKAILYIAKLLFAFPFFPLLPFMMAYDAKDWSLARNYFGTLGYVARTLMIHFRFGSFARAIKYNIMMSPEQVQARLERRRGACTRCAKCCKQYDCIFLGVNEDKEHFCKVYGTNYWYYGTCGRYPLDQADIDDHACPGFSFEDGA